MSHRALSRNRVLLAAGLMVALILGATFTALGQSGQGPPLVRSNVSRIDGLVPANLLAAGPEAYIRGDVNTDFSMNYKCTKDAAGTPDSGILSGNCALGTSSGTTSRFVTVFYSFNSTAPTVSSKQFNLTNTQAQTLAAPYDQTFGGSHDFGTNGVVEGQAVNFFVRVPVTKTASNPGTCSGGGTGNSITCFDTADTSKQSYYTVKIDASTPTLFVDDPDNANVYKTSDTAWWLYTNKNLSNKLPTIRITVIDDVLGSAINQDATKIYRAGTLNTTRFDKTVIGTGRAVLYTYNYAAANVLSFEDNTTTRFDLEFADKVRHTVDTRGATNPGLWVITDITPPTLDNTTSFLSRTDASRTSGGGLAALGEKLRVFTYANDTAVTLDTPARHLTATVQLATGPGLAMRSPSYPLAYNSTTDRYISTNVTIPATWASGRTAAFVTITDPVGQSVTKRINGTVSVDIDKPVITPVSPIGKDKAEDFLNRATVDFRLRAVDPNDGDTWAGAQTVDTDKIGIDLNSVRLFFKVGATGAVSSVKLGALTAENTFGGTRTFNPEDEVFYYFQAKDLAGNTVRYPAAADAHIAHTNKTFNEGRFIRLQIDQLGPSIKEARSLAYVGAGPHVFNFLVSDSGIGLDKTSPTLLWRIKGDSNYREVALAEAVIKLKNATGVLKDTNVWQASVPTQAEGTVVEWHVSAKDKLDNAATLGTSTSPKSSIVDVTPPTVTMTAPATTDNARFDITWTGADAGAGVQDYTLQFRASGGAWFTVPSRDRTALTSYSVCAAAGQTYDFRLSARDNAGNERVFPAAPDGSTQVLATVSCAQIPDVVIASPAAGETIRGAIDVLYSAVSVTHPTGLNIRVQVGSGGTFSTLGTDLANSGTFAWDTSAPNTDSVCVPDGPVTVRVIAIDPNGLEGKADAANVRLDNGITDCNDRDNDGLSDQWEFLNFGDLSQDGDGDPDGDGFTNRQEFAAGTNPANAASKPGDGTTPGGTDADTGWDNLYLLVVVAFVGVLGTFVVGMTRRW